MLFRSTPTSSVLTGIACESSALFGFLAIRFLLGLLRRTGFGVFALYRVFLALGLFAWWAGHR